jgi:hypothetical protein
LRKGTTWGGAYDVSLGAEGRDGEYNMSLIQHSDAAKAIKKTKRHLPEPHIISKIRGEATVNCEKVF